MVNWNFFILSFLLTKLETEVAPYVQQSLPLGYRENPGFWVDRLLEYRILSLQGGVHIYPNRSIDRHSDGFGSCRGFFSQQQRIFFSFLSVQLLLEGVVSRLQMHGLRGPLGNYGAQKLIYKARIWHKIPRMKGNGFRFSLKTMFLMKNCIKIPIYSKIHAK